MKNKILVTGANGFIGTHLVTELTKRGASIQKVSHQTLRDPVGLSLIEGLKETEYIFHLAAYGNMAQQLDEKETLDANVSCVWNLLQATKLIPYKACINISSSSVLLPYQTMYAATKKAGEALCQAFIDNYHKPIVTVRPYSVYGPGEASYRFIPTVFRSCLKGEPMTLAQGSHDWVFIADVIEYLLGLSKAVAEHKFSSTSECGTGISTSNEQVVKMIEEITGKKAHITERKQLRSFDVNEWKAGWSNPGYTQLRDGLQKYYDSSKND